MTADEWVTPRRAAAHIDAEPSAVRASIFRGAARTRVAETKSGKLTILVSLTDLTQALARGADPSPTPHAVGNGGQAVDADPTLHVSVASLRAETRAALDSLRLTTGELERRIAALEDRT